jgi:muramoyltetrapeptide carboxypeptidase LdcA involved in peptidoglycan recycling
MINKVTLGLEISKKIRVIAPVRSMSIIPDTSIKLANEALENEGFELSFGKNIYEIDEFNSSKIESRIFDLHRAFEDEHINVILSVIGGYNSNQLLKYIDYDLIKNNPKIICGFSDMTALLNAISVKTGLVTYLGPHYSSWGMEKGFEYTKEYFLKAYTGQDSYEIVPSAEWSDDVWYLDQKNRNFIPNEGFWIINEGEATGTIYGGNIGTFSLLQGTEFFPNLNNSILAFEDTDEISPAHFDRLLQSVIHQKDFNGVKGILIGRFQKGSKITQDKLIKIIKSKRELENIPVVANVDFGHTTPMVTLPIGGKLEFKAFKNHAIIKVLEH